MSGKCFLKYFWERRVACAAMWNRFVSVVSGVPFIVCDTTLIMDNGAPTDEDDSKRDEHY